MQRYGEENGKIRSAVDGGMGPPSAPDEADFMVRDFTFLMLSFLRSAAADDDDDDAHAAAVLS